MQNQTAVDTSQHIYNEDNEQHVRAIDRLVNELGIPAEEVNKSYREVLEELKKDIKVNAFLPILVSRVVKQRLFQQQ
jgi:short-subunit dehydrogenase involved in D-alanine esterification of teichoic acids